VNKIRGLFQSVAVKAPGFGERRKAMLGDIAVLSGAQLISEEVALSSRTRRSTSWVARGACRHKDDTTIVDGAGAEDDVKGRISQIKREIEETDSDWDREKLQERLAKLAGASQSSRWARRPRSSSRRRSTASRTLSPRPAQRSRRASSPVAARPCPQPRCCQQGDRRPDRDEATGAAIVGRALAEPLKWIAINAGFEAL